MSSKNFTDKTSMSLMLRSYFLQSTDQIKLQGGFTLVELLVVVIILVILAAIALPNLLQQVAKGREAEAITNFGAINRAQQVFRYENGTFGTVCSNDILSIGDWCDGSNGTLPIKIKPSPYYKYTDSVIPSRTSASYYADVTPQYDNELKDYSASVGLTDSGVFSAIICGAINFDPVGGMGVATNGTACGHNSVSVQ